MKNRNAHLLMTLLIPGALATLASGCGHTPTPAPFHMYSSPLLEGDSGSLDPAARDYPGGLMETSPGVQQRQVYSYQRWGQQGIQKSPRQIRPGQAPGSAPLDTVTPPDRPVLRNYSGFAVGAGRADGDNGGSDKPATPTADESVSTVGEPRLIPKDAPETDPRSLSAGFIFTLLRINDVDVADEAATSIPELYRHCRADGEIYHSSRPNIGDLVFFHNTFDANQDGRNNDWYTQVGIVEQVHSNGTVDFLAYHLESVTRLQMNLDHAGERWLGGNQSANTRLRKDSPEDPPFTQYLSGQLFAGFCNILGDQDDLIVIDNWSPELSLE